MTGKQINVFVSQIFAVEGLYSVCKELSIQLDETLLGKLSDERSDVFMLYIGVSIILGTAGRILGVTIACKELQLLCNLSGGCVLMTVKDVSLGHIVMAAIHKCYLHFILNLLNAHSILKMRIFDDVQNLA